MVDQRSRKEWLEKEIENLTDISLFADLPQKDQHNLVLYCVEYEAILEQEHEEQNKVKTAKSREMKQRRGRGHYGETRLAKKVGGVVVGRSKYIVTPSGKGIKINCQKPPDVVNDWASFESKYILHVPKMLQRVMTQAISNAPEGLTPWGVIGDREQRTVYYICIEKDWLELHGGNIPETLPNAPERKIKPMKVKKGSIEVRNEMVAKVN